MKDIITNHIIDTVVNRTIRLLIGFGLLLLIIVVPFGVIFHKQSIYPKVEVLVDNKLIFTGSSACVDIKSSGFNTTVTTSDGLCILPVQTYTSKDVVVRTVKD